MKLSLTLILALSISIAFGQPKKTEVLTLGTFHFNFLNLDVSKITASDQSDVLQPKYQKDIEDIVRRVAAFKPSIIVIERDPVW